VAVGILSRQRFQGRGGITAQQQRSGEQSLRGLGEPWDWSNRGDF